MWVSWYATVLRQDAFAAEVARVGSDRAALRRDPVPGARQPDDRYKITQMTWFESKADWYRYWDGPEMIEFRARNPAVTRSRSSTPGPTRSPPARSAPRCPPPSPSQWILNPSRRPPASPRASGAQPRVLLRLVEGVAMVAGGRLFEAARMDGQPGGAVAGIDRRGPQALARGAERDNAQRSVAAHGRGQHILVTQELQRSAGCACAGAKDGGSAASAGGRVPPAARTGSWSAPVGVTPRGSGRGSRPRGRSRGAHPTRSDPAPSFGPGCGGSPATSPCCGWARSETAQRAASSGSERPWPPPAGRRHRAPGVPSPSRWDPRTGSAR